MNVLQDIVGKYPFFLHYKGNYRDNLTLRIVDIVEANLALYYKKHFVNKLSYLVVEAVQNIERYSSTNGSSDDFCFIFSDGKNFHIITQNNISNDKIDGLKKRLDEVNTKNEEELNKIYLEVLSSGESTEKGAGLGLIDMARKTKNSLNYSFLPKNESNSHYRLHLKIAILNEEATDNTEEFTNETITAFDALFSTNKNTLFYSGDFSNSFLQSLLNMISNLKKTDHLPVNSVFKYAIIELTQNMKRHAHKIDDKIWGYICLEWDNEKSCISTFNFTTEKSALELEQKINRLNSSSLEGLNEESEEFMTDFSQIGGLGLIDIARLNFPQKIHAKFDKTHKFGQSAYLKIQFDHGK